MSIELVAFRRSALGRARNGGSFGEECPKCGSRRAMFQGRLAICAQCHEPIVKVYGFGRRQRIAEQGSKFKDLELLDIQVQRRRLWHVQSDINVRRRLGIAVDGQRVAKLKRFTDMMRRAKADRHRGHVIGNSRWRSSSSKVTRSSG
jgi:hypothetical protein